MEIVRNVRLRFALPGIVVDFGRPALAFLNLWDARDAGAATRPGMLTATHAGIIHVCMGLVGSAAKREKRGRSSL
jgi:hypothetical protein